MFTPVLKPTKPASGLLVTLRDIEAYVEYAKRDQAMDDEERNQLAILIGDLRQDQQLGIVQIVQDGSSNHATEGDQFTFDLQNLSSRKQRELEAYVKKCILGAASRGKKL